MVDGFTSIFSGILFFIIFRKEFFERNIPVTDKYTAENRYKSDPLKDKIFLAFTICTVIFATLFFQLLFTLPLYYKEVYQMNDKNVGFLLAVNGAIVFLSEMVLVHYLSRYKIYKLIIIGVLLIGGSFLLLNFFHGFYWLILGMVMISYGEILTMPFMMSFTSNKADDSSRGRYMAFYSLTYSIGLILAPFIGLRIIKHFGYYSLWWLVFLASIIIGVGYYFILRKYKVDPVDEVVVSPALGE